MMKYYILIGFLLVCTVIFAQQPPIKEKAKNYYFYKKDGITEVSTADSADIVQIISEPDSGENLFDVREYYKTGKLHFIGRSLFIHPILKEEQGVYFYPNTQKSQIVNYKDNKPVENSIHYYPNGKLYFIVNYFEADSINSLKHKVLYRDSVIKVCNDSLGHNLLDSSATGYFKRYTNDFTAVAEEGMLKNGKPDGNWKGYNALYKVSFMETYANGKLLNGSAIDSAGIVHHYIQRVKPGNFKGGLDNFFKSMGQNVRYPKASRENGIQGEVIIYCKTDKDGSLKNVDILKSLDTDTDNESVRIIKTSPAGVPEENYGIIHDWRYYIRIDYKLIDRFYANIFFHLPISFSPYQL